MTATLLFLLARVVVSSYARRADDARGCTDQKVKLGFLGLALSTSRDGIDGGDSVFQTGLCWSASDFGMLNASD